jgi:tetratricopeptide (TPR) repeat protein
LPKVFISYKWEDESHNKWVEKLATDLSLAGVDVHLDRWDVRYGDSFIDYMTRRISDADIFLFVMTRRSVKAVEAADNKGGGVKFENEMAKARQLAGEKVRIIGILREGKAAPAYLKARRYADFRDDTQYETGVKELVNDLLGKGKRPLIQVAASTPEAYSSLADSYFEEGDYDMAIAHYNRAITLDPDNSTLYLKRGKSHYRKDDYGKALADYNVAVKLAPDAVAYYSRGIIYCRTHKYKEAISDFSNALQQDSDNAEYFYLRGNGYYEIHDYKKAVADYRRAIKLGFKNAEIYKRLGVSYYHVEDYDTAMTNLGRAIRLDDKQSDLYRRKGEVHKRRGEIHQQQNQYDEAITEYTQAIRLIPDDAGLYALRGECYFYQEKTKWNEAITDFTRAIELDPSNLNYYLWRGVIFKSIGDVPAYECDFKKGPPLEELRNSRDKYETLRAYLRSGLREKLRGGSAFEPRAAEELAWRLGAISAREPRVVINNYLAEIFEEEKRHLSSEASVDKKGKSH